MSNPNSESKLPKRSAWPRRLAFLVSGFVLLAAAAYFTVTSTFFLRRVILPRVGESLNAEVTIEGASINPWSSIVLRGLKVQPVGQPPLLEVNETRILYRLTDLLRGDLKFAEVSLEAPRLNVVLGTNGTSNLDPVLEATRTPEPEPPASTAPTTLELGKLEIRDGRVVYTRSPVAGRPVVAALSLASLRIEGLKNAGTAKVELNAGFTYEAGDDLAGTLNGAFDIALDADLQPLSIVGGAQGAVTAATGAFADAAQLGLKIETSLTRTEIKRLALSFAKGESALGQAVASGPFDPAKQEGRLKLQVAGIGPDVLSLVGGPYGVSFGQSQVAADADLELKRGGTALAATGTLTARNFTLTREGQTTPVLDLDLAYDAAADRTANTASLRAFSMKATQAGRPLLAANLSKPMKLDWTSSSSGVEESSLEATLTDLNLADWREFLDPSITAGHLGAKLALNVRDGGGRMVFNLDSQLRSLTAQGGTNRIERADIALVAEGELTRFEEIKLAALDFTLQQTGRTLATAKASGNVNLRTQATDLTSELTAALPEVTRWVPVPDTVFSRGSLKFGGRVTQATAGDPPSSVVVNRAVRADLQLTDVAGEWAAKPFEQLNVTARLDASMAGQVVELRQASVSLPATSRAQNEARLTGRVDMTRTNAITGNLRFQADSLDLTAYRNLFVSDGPASEGEGPGEAGTGVSETEPPPLVMPLRDFVVEAGVGRFHLGDLVVSNFIATTRIDGGKVKLDPFQLTINGAPATAKADLDLSVPGYRYDVNLNTERLPLPPLVDTFQPDRKGQIRGVLSAVGRVQGQGTTSASLREHLSGRFDVGATNLALKVINVRNSLLKAVVNVVIGLPDIIRGSQGQAGAVVGQLLGAAGGGKVSGWVEGVSEPPIDVIAFSGQADKGRLNVQNALVQSTAFKAETRGTLELASKFDDSPIGFPVTLSLNPELAGKIGQVSSSTPTNAAYVKLPEFLTIGGTLGQPERKLNAVALGQMGVRLASSLTGDSGNATLDRISGVLGALGGGGATGAPAGTNAPPATNATPQSGNLLDRLKRR